jgi:RNA polymerase sigma-70 factor (ECF subfamily)
MTTAVISSTPAPAAIIVNSLRRLPVLSTKIGLIIALRLLTVKLALWAPFLLHLYNRSRVLKELCVTQAEPINGTAEDLSSAVQAAVSGRDEGFRALYRAVQPGLLRYLKALVGADAEDVASETWLHIVRDLHTFKGDGEAFRRWAVTIGRHRAMDHLRRNQRRPSIALPVDALTELTGSDDTAVAAIEMLTTDSALAMIASLPQDQAEAVLLRVVVGLDANSAAQVLGKRSGAVRTAAYRGLKRLAERLNGRGNGYGK